MARATQAFILSLGLPTIEASNLFEDDSPFYYDWESLQLGGTILAGLLCIAGIACVLSGKCKCKQSKRPSPPPEGISFLKAGTSGC